MIWIEPLVPAHVVGLAVVPSEIVGVPGSVKLTGPASVFDVQPAIVTLMFVYVPAFKPEIVISPEALLESDTPTATASSS